jgi:hypothetical protein
MSGSEPKGKYGVATIGFLVVIAFVIVGATIQNRPITIAASDNPPSISTPVSSFIEADRKSMEERRATIGSSTPNAHEAPQIFYRGGAVPP